MVEYFVKNKHLNHVLLTMFVIVGVYMYNVIPKEMFPETTLEKINISGSYQGSSIDNLNNLIVKDIESNLTDIDNVKETLTTIKPGQFSITLEMNSAKDIDKKVNDIKDIIDSLKSNLPSDMNDPIVKRIETKFPLIDVVISSDKYSYEDLIKKANEIKDNLLFNVNGISDITIYGEKDKVLEFVLNDNKIKSYGLSLLSVKNAIGSLSSIFPIGNIEDTNKGFTYISTNNGKDSIDEWLNTFIKVDSKIIKLKDVASIKEYVPEDEMMTSFNGKKSIILKLQKASSGNTITIVENINKKLEELSNSTYSDLNLNTTNDSSDPIKERLNTVTSNLLFGLILIFFSMYILVNRSTAIVVTIGIPFAFIVGIIFIYIAGYTINMISLIGGLIVIGLAVDDAVVVSENIQKYIDQGMNKYDAAIKGSKELIKPITLSVLTTVATFLPLLMISGTLGKFIMLIPIAVVLILMGSLLETFVFLPLHSEHIMNKNNKSLDWTVINNKYEKLLHYVIHWKKTTLLFFFIIVPTLTVLLFSNTKKVFFPGFDGNQITINAKLPTNYELEDTYNVAKNYELYFLKNKEKYYIKNISIASGYKVGNRRQGESGKNFFNIILELNKKREDNLYTNYIEPFMDLSFDFEKKEYTRLEDSNKIVSNIRNDLKEENKKYPFETFELSGERIGITNNDIEIKLIGEESIVGKALLELENIVKNKEFYVNSSTNIDFGKDEIKLKINKYGESLGLNESNISSYLTPLYLNSRVSKTFGDDGLMEIKTKSLNKDDLNKFYEQDVNINNQFVKLKEVVDFIKIKNYEKLEKENGLIIKQLNINVEKSKTSTIEFTDNLMNDIENLKNKYNLKVQFGGEQEKNKEFANDMLKAIVIALFLIVILLLLIFPNIKYVAMIISMIPLSLLGSVGGHWLLDKPLSILSYVGMLGLAGVVINTAIVMLEFLDGTTNKQKFYHEVKLRLRPVFITTITTFLGLSSLIFYATGQAVIMQPLAISLGFGLLWGIVLTLIYIPALYALSNKINEPVVEIEQIEINNKI